MRLFENLVTLIPPHPWPEGKGRLRAAPGPRVILLHGLWRSSFAMEALAKDLHEAGYETLNLPYPSFTRSPDELVEIIANELSRYPHKVTHFVTHSLGGIILRHLTARHPETLGGRAVMIAPPHQGSEIIDWLEDSPLGRLFGPAGLSLSTSRVPREVPPLPTTSQAGIIMGRSNRIPFFQSLLEEENDGIVSLSRARLNGVSHFEVVDADHTFIVTDPTVRKLTRRFLEKGHFHPDNPPQ